MDACFHHVSTNSRFSRIAEMDLCCFEFSISLKIIRKMKSICCCFGKDSNAVDDVQIPLQPRSVFISQKYRKFYVFSARAPCFVAPVPKLDLSEVADNVSYGTGCHTGTRSFGSEITTTRTSGSSSRYWDTEAIERLETEKICHKIIDDLVNALPIRAKQRKLFFSVVF